MRTEGFELYQSDDEIVGGTNEQQCIEQCESNKVSNSSTKQFLKLFTN